MPKFIYILKKSLRWYWIPAAVFLLGLFSITLLLWVDKINEKLHSYAVLGDAVKEIQNNTATSHYLFEENIHGDISDKKSAFAALDRAMELADSILGGGTSEYGHALKPLTDAEMRDRALAVKSLLIEYKKHAAARLASERPGEWSVQYRQFHNIFKKILLEAGALEDIIERTEAEDQIRLRRLFRVVLGAWALIVAAATGGLLGRERQRRIAGETVEEANRQLLSQTEELREHREHLSELVEQRTAELSAANELLKREVSERREAEAALMETDKQVRSLSSRLLNAQEVERRRISMELHDELGQALNAMKLQVKVIEGELREGQEAIKEDCDKLRRYMDSVIEDVRRLSLNLSPVVLEDIGLTSALKWLCGNLAETLTAEINVNIENLDHLFFQDRRITVYRVVQEALTNILKHAQPEKVSLVVRVDDGRVFFTVEDDGKGFDLRQAEMKDSPERGFGLTTMSERVRIMGGIFDLWSREGEGTRIAFSIPIEREGDS